MELLRESPAGQAIRWFTGNRYLQYPEERSDFSLPNCYNQGSEKLSTSQLQQSGEPAEQTHAASEALSRLDTAEDVEKPSSGSSRSSTQPGSLKRHFSDASGQSNLARARTMEDVEQAYEDAVRQESLRAAPSQPIQPQKTSDGRTLVDWYTTDDPANPQNWSTGKKVLVVVQIYFYTLAVYIASAIYTPSIPYVIEQFGVSSNLASLGLSIYVVGYGWGPLIFSPLSEIPVIGRNPPYVITFFIYVLLSIGSATVNNFPGLIVLRFLQGFFGSPALATGGASLGDLSSFINLPYFLLGWAAFATAGPALGPLISGFSVPKTNWHWSLWEVVWLAGPVFVSWLFLMPETSGPNILLRRAKRLRKLTGNSNLVAQSEIDQANLTPRTVAIDALWKPLQLNLLDPSVLFTTVYIGLMYGIFYSFFESFPLVYGTGLDTPGHPSPTKGYHFNAGEQGLVFLSITVGVAVAIVTYVSYLYFFFNPGLRANLAAGKGLGAPERRIIPGLFASFLIPIGLFMFAWTSFDSPRIPWIVPTIGIGIFVIGVFIIFQVVFIYLALSYPQYAASLFAGNDVARSSIAAGAIHFAHPLFNNLGIGRGTSLLAGCTVMGVIGIFILYFYGGWLRSRSRFTAK